MKKSINTLQDALAFQLERLIYTERKIKDDFNLCKNHIISAPLKKEINDYINTVDSKLLKLDRIFSYLMQEPLNRKNEITNKLLDETHYMLCNTGCSNLKDIIMISCFQNITAYKISSYKTAYRFAAELELDTATDLLQQILEWEIEIGKKLSALSIEEFNKIQQTAN
jgi:ferritin-like metal-binding protein YciE